LLPQPFTLDLAAKAGRLFGGRAFLHEQSTTGSFIQNAGHHRIIHIGTHAESDNLHPEFSRLIFAKDRDAAGEDNYLYLPQIYQCDLTADLAVLTACESGKPGFADGEGMISLAHAFNYAGSESIITGLWKIDEQVSALLMEQVYQNLLAGMTKDEALRQAKLSYLEQAGGRALAPQFWAGLVVMGDTGPVALNASRTLAWWWSGGGVLAILFLLGLIYRRRHKKMPHRRVSL
jgi:CHAT domain-containing protein